MADPNKEIYRPKIHTGSVLDDVDVKASRTLDDIGVEILPLHTGGTVHAKRTGGKFRTFKWLAASFWIILFIGPYMRWDGSQAILWDLANRQFHIFSLTILPQDIWMLAMILLFFALLLAASTAIAGRVWCGYFCFHTVWVDVFTWIEEKIEGRPAKRIKLDAEPMSFSKFKIKLPKHLAWIAIAFMTGFSFVAYFTDAFQLWERMLSFQLGSVELAVIGVLAVLTYLTAGFMREQVCMGFCPYSRIQGAMTDTETVMPTYDRDRGEPRGRAKRPKPGEEAPVLGDCIDCRMCVDVCPTGVDIRLGQQFGCITCGLCIDACDEIMEKVKKPKGLIRYAAINEFAGKALPPIWRRPRVIVYSSIMAIAAAAMIWGLSNMAPMDVTVLKDRSPLFVQMSDGTIQNKYEVKVVNKTNEVIRAQVEVFGHDNLVYIADRVADVAPGTVGTISLLVRIPRSEVGTDSLPIDIVVTDQANPQVVDRYRSVFHAPK
ncbi:cytochrome c oxidase accessory protein CcoG [Thiomicrospira microaerophila]|uniref:cytochrome c oxidase accessory protein CcoG n=1 Tax=Thiomicrospira microaerophila TaxID=406020 RepID=UPI0005CAB8B0|nr:cytochrome c oxidase accessory protein CcoG [Thiomicrospira microaerophila]